MLGTEVMRCLARDESIRAIGTTIADMDITNIAHVMQTLQRHRPTHIIHCAAFTFVDLAEKQTLLAYQINAEGTKNLAFFCREMDIELLYISTDYVFPGDKDRPYLETDRTGPINAYGMTKLLGEVYIQSLLEQYKIVRTSWLNGLGGDYTRNFIETMLRVSESRSVLSLVNDQFGRPTFTFDLALALVTLLDVNSYGVFHVTNSGEASWYDLAKEVFDVAGKKDITLRPVLSEQFRSAARRPGYSVLDNRRFPALGLKLLPDWRDSLREYFRRRALSNVTTYPEAVAPSPRSLKV
jgi:dTDP-4-dehydrorhamnose reductase